MTYLLRAVLLSALAVPAMAQAPATLTALAECRLSYAQAKSLIATVKPTSTKDLSEKESDNIVSFYNPATVKPFGLAAREFSTDEYADYDFTDYAFVTRLAVPFDRAQAAMLKSYRLTACDAPNEFLAGRHCLMPTRKDVGKSSGTIKLSLLEQPDGVFLRCSYG